MSYTPKQFQLMGESPFVEITEVLGAKCIYLLTDATGDEILYVGQSQSVLQRMRDHIKHKKFSRAFALDVGFHDLGDVEKAFIRQYLPKLNRQMYPGCKPNPELVDQIWERNLVTGGLDEAFEGDVVGYLRRFYRRLKIHEFEWEDIERRVVKDLTGLRATTDWERKVIQFFDSMPYMLLDLREYSELGDYLTGYFRNILCTLDRVEDDLWGSNEKWRVEIQLDIKDWDELLVVRPAVSEWLQFLNAGLFAHGRRATKRELYEFFEVLRDYGT